MTTNPPAYPALETRHLNKSFRGRGGVRIHAVNDVSLSIRSGETVGLIGESGSGKSTLGRLMLGLLQPDSGDVLLGGTSIVGSSARDLRRLRGNMQVVFQEPYESLNPRLKVSSLVAEPLIVQGVAKKEYRQRVAEVLDLVGLAPALASRYPGGLSGGQQQRVGIARAIVGRPDFVVLDEPTASLDRTTRLQITDLLIRLQADLGLAYLLITHDIASVRRMAGRSLVLFHGHIVESGPTADVLSRPGHPYTRALVSAELPARIGALAGRYRLKPREAVTPDDASGCPLRPICPLAVEECAAALPPLLRVSEDHEARCIRWQDLRSSPGGRAPSQAADAADGCPERAPAQTLPNSGSE